MAKRDWDKKEIIVIVLLLLGGVAFTTASFCIYYLVDALNTAGLVIICVADFLYTLFITSLMCKYGLEWKKWFLKALLMSVGYIAAFILLGILIMGKEGSWWELIANNILYVVFYAIFTAPCIFIVVPIVLMGLSYIGGA